MDHVDIMNHLIEKYNYNSYLEIGLGTGESYLKVQCRHKESVDPYEGTFDRNNSQDVSEFVEKNLLTHKMTSDEFFETAGKDKKWDIIFIDGLHTEEQVDKDILNSLKHLNPGGKIVVHDCLPVTKEHQSDASERPIGTWNGTVWKSIPKLSLMGINYFTVDTDTGCCIIDYCEHTNNLKLPAPADYNYDTVFGSYYLKCILFRIISTETFYSIY